MMQISTHDSSNVVQKRSKPSSAAPHDRVHSYRAAAPQPYHHAHGYRLAAAAGKALHSGGHPVYDEQRMFTGE